MYLVEQHFELRHDNAITMMEKKKIKQRTHKYERVLQKEKAVQSKKQKQKEKPRLMA